MLETIVRALGRGLVAILAGLWNGLVLPVLHGIGHGLGGIARAVMPWVVGGGLLWFLVVFQPEVANSFLSLAILVAVVWVGFRLMFRGGRRQPPHH